MTAEAIIDHCLPSSWSMKKRTELSDAIVSALFQEGHLADADGVTEVEVNGARVPVERVTAYGLELQVDANGEAVTVRHPRGLVVIER